MTDGARPDRTDDEVDFLAASSLVDDPVFLATRLGAVGSSQANAALAELGIKVRHYSVLSLACSGLGPTQRELSQALLLDPSQIVSLVDDLEALQAVTRQPDERDRRSKVIVPTAAGRDLCRRAKEVITSASRGTLEPLTAAERGQLVRLLARASL